MTDQFTATARRVGIVSAIIVVALVLAYAVTFGIGFASLASPDQPIGDPMFTIIELLIIGLMPAMVVLMAAVHAWASIDAKMLSLISLVFMSLLAGVTCMVHFPILTLSRQPAFAALPLLPLLFSFKWPSVAYAFDILGWDVFFSLSMLFAAPVFRGSGLARSIRILMIVSGGLALAGLGGVVTGDMNLRNIGIVGNVGVFLIVAALLAVLFHRTRPAPADAGGIG